MEVQNTYDSNFSVSLLEINIKHSHTMQSMACDACDNQRVHSLLRTAYVQSNMAWGQLFK
jgi:hypothetical protein